MNELYHIDRLDKNDYNRGFLQLLEELTTVNSDSITYEEFCKRYDEINSTIFVIRNLSTNMVVATGSIIIEKKFIHNLGSVGHIEDIVVSEKYRKMGFGKTIINKLVEYAKYNNCYKVILNCEDNNIGFYEKCGFKRKESEMVLYFD